MGGPVLHSPYCAWRRGGECSCGGNRNARPKEIVLCMVCTDEPCTCAAYAVPANVGP